MNYFGIVMNLIIFLVIAFTPFYSKKSVLFGYRIGEELGNGEQANGIRRRYLMRMLVMIPVVFALSYLLPVVGEVVFGVQVVLYLLSQYGMYALARNESQKWIESHSGEIEYQKKVVVSTGKREIGVSPYWFLMSLGIVVIMFVINFTFYDQIPQQLPLRYDLLGNVTGQAEKSLWELSKLPLIALLATAVVFYSFLVTGRSKEELSGKNVRRSMRDSREFRRVVAKMLVGLSVLINLTFFYAFLLMTGILPINVLVNGLVLFGLPLMIMGGVVYLVVKVGQDGSRLGAGVDVGAETEEDEIILDDNAEWKWGIFYFNPADPAVWVPKRFGLGRTLNFARVEAWLFLVGLVGIVVLISVIG